MGGIITAAAAFHPRIESAILPACLIIRYGNHAIFMYHDLFDIIHFNKITTEIIQYHDDQSPQRKRRIVHLAAPYEQIQRLRPLYYDQFPSLGGCVKIHEI